MNALLVSALFGLAGVTAYAAMHHALMASRHPPDHRHLWFALACLAMAAYVVAEAWGYQAQSASDIVNRRRWDIAFIATFFVLFTWFLRAYTGSRPIRAPLMLSGFLLVLLTANFVLPYGLLFPELPEFTQLTLPWGEQVADLRVHQPSGWYHAGWLAMLSVLGYGFHAAVMQHRRGERGQARRLIVALAAFLLLMLFNQLANRGIVEFVRIAPFGFLALVLLMSHALMREQRETHQYMRALLDNVPALVYAKDLQGRFLIINRPFEELFRVRSTALSGRTDETLFPSNQASAVRAHDRKVAATRQPMEFEEVVNLDDTPRTFRTFKFPVLNADDTPYAVCGVSVDITETRKRQQELSILRNQVWHADRVARLNAIGTSLAHEMKQPLTAMLTNAETGLRLLVRSELDRDEIREILNDIVRDSSRAMAIIDAMRDMLRHTDSARERLRLAETIGEVLDLMQGEMRRSGVDCERSLDHGCVVVGDKVQLSQVVVNLVMNALDAMTDIPPGEKHLFVSVADDRNGDVHAVVRDTGSGLPSGEPDRIFDPFFSTRDRGVGMGLALSRSIVEAHGGRIWAADDPGGGTSVHIVLPHATEDGP